jgi:hypothetical protein
MLLRFTVASAYRSTIQSTPRPPIPGLPLAVLAGLLGIGCASAGETKGREDIARESAALTAAFSLPLPVGTNPTDLAMAASVSLSVNDGASVQELATGDRAMVWNQGAGLPDNAVGTNIGVSSSVGTILSRALVSLRAGAVVSGSVYQGSTARTAIQPVVTITDMLQTSVPFTKDTSWTRSVTWPTTFLSTPNLEPGQPPATVALAPGAYHAIDVKTGRTLLLSGGNYFFDSFIVESGAGLYINASNGPVFVYVLASGFTFRGNMSPGVNSPGMSVPSLTVMTTGSAIVTTPFTGVVIAPNGSINLGSQPGYTFCGAFFGRDVTLFERGIIRHYQDPFSFRGYGPSDGTPFIGDRVSVTGGSIRFPGGDKTDEAVQNEPAIAVSSSGSGSVVTVGYNDWTTSPSHTTILYTEPKNLPGRGIPDARNGAGRELREGVTAMAWSFSKDGGHTFQYGGHLVPPTGWSILWGDASIAKLKIDDPNVYYAQEAGTTTAFESMWDSSRKAIVDKSPLAALNGYCVARSTDRGITFGAMACVPDEFQDGSSLAVATGAGGGREVYVSGHKYHVFRLNGETMTFASNDTLPLPFAEWGSHPRMKVFDGVLYIAADFIQVVGADLNHVIHFNRLNAAQSATMWMGDTVLATATGTTSNLDGSGANILHAHNFAYDFGNNAVGAKVMRMMYQVDDPGFGTALTTIECNVDLTGCTLPLDGWSTRGQPGDEYEPSLAFDNGHWVAMWRQTGAPGSATGGKVAVMAGELGLSNGNRVLTKRTLSLPVVPCFYGDASFARWGEYDHIGSFGDGRFLAAYTVNGPGCRFQGTWTSDQHVGGSVFAF